MDQVQKKEDKTMNLFLIMLLTVFGGIAFVMSIRMIYGHDDFKRYSKKPRKMPNENERCFGCGDPFKDHKDNIKKTLACLSRIQDIAISEGLETLKEQGKKIS